MKQTSFAGNDFTIKPIPNDCTFRGTIRKGSYSGEETFEASAELHQRHTNDFSCRTVLFHEQKDGRHIDGCPHVGFWTAKACGCNDGR